MRKLFAPFIIATVALLAVIGGQTAQAQPTAGAQAPAQTQAQAQLAQKASIQSTEYNGVCEVGEVCLYFNSNCQGSFADFYGAIPDFAGYKFLSAGNGKGQGVKNNAASAKNRDTSHTARIHFNSNYSGSYDNIAPQTSCQNLQKTYNENASLSWYS